MHLSGISARIWLPASALACNLSTFGISDPTNVAATSETSSSGDSGDSGVSEPTPTSSGPADTSTTLADSGDGTEPAATSTTTTGSTSDATTSATSSTASDPSTGGPIDCTELDEVGCTGAGCLVIFGRRFNSDDADLCLEPAAFLGCVDPMSCGELETYACHQQDKFLLKDTCLPARFQACSKPPDPGNDGWPDCQ